MTDTDAHAWVADRDRLIGAGQEWLKRCQRVVTSGSDAQALRDELIEGSAAYEALYESSDMKWARPLGELKDFGLDDEEITTPELATAFVIAELAEALTSSSADDALREALAHFDFSGVRSAGTQLVPGESPLTIGDATLPTMTRALLGAVDHLSRGFVMLLLCELSERRPPTNRETSVPVLFRTSDSAGTRGEAGTLTLAVLDGGPSGLHPDPATMAFLQADPSVSVGLEAAWATSGLASTGACVVWSVTTGKNVPCLKIEGNSMSAAFAVALDDVAPRRRLQRLRRLRTLDRSCAVTAGLNGSQLTEVVGYEDKTKAARAHGYRVVVAKSALDVAQRTAPPDWVVRISGAETVDEAIAETRTVVNRPLVLTAAALVITVVMLVVGGFVGWSRIQTEQRERLSAQLASDANAQVNSDSRIAALLALTADQLHASPTTRAAIRSVADNNASVAASAMAGDTSIEHVAAFSGVALTSTSGSSTVKGWTLPGLKPLGELDLDGQIAGMGGGGYAESGIIAVLAGSSMKIFQGGPNAMPTQVASFTTPFDDPNTEVFGPYVDPASNAIVAFDKNFRGLFWTPGMQTPDTLDLSGRINGNPTLVAVSEFGQRNSSNLSDQQARDTSGRTVLLGTSNRDVYEFRLDQASKPPNQKPDRQAQASSERIYDASQLLASLDSPIHSLAISPLGSTLVGTDTGLRQFDRDAGQDAEEPDVDGTVKERITAIVPAAMFSDDVMVLTANSLGYINSGRVTQLTNTDPTTAVRRSISSMTATADGTVLTGRADGRIVLHDPTNALTRLTDRWGATAMQFTREGQFVRTDMVRNGSNYSDGVAVGNVSAETEAQTRLRELAGDTGSTPVDEDTYRLDDSGVQAHGVDATTDTVAATGINTTSGRAYVWVWNRNGPDDPADGPAQTLSFEGPSPSSETLDIGYGLALSPDGSRVYAYNSGRGQMTAWSTEDGHLLWTTTIPVAIHPRAALGAQVTFDGDRRRALIDHFDDNGDQAHTFIDLNDGAATKLAGLADYHDTFLSPTGDAVVASNDNDIAIFEIRGDADPTVGLQAGPVNLGAIVGSIAWSADEERLAVDLFGSGQITFVSTTTLEEDGPRWRMAGFGPNDSVTGLAWSPDGHYIAINVGTQQREAQFRTDSVRMMLADDTDMTSALCKIAGSDWTTDEWQKYVGDEDQFTVCG